MRHTDVSRGNPVTRVGRLASRLLSFVAVGLKVSYTAGRIRNAIRVVDFVSVKHTSVFQLMKLPASCTGLLLLRGFYLGLLRCKLVKNFTNGRLGSLCKNSTMPANKVSVDSDGDGEKRKMERHFST